MLIKIYFVFFKSFKFYCNISFIWVLRRSNILCFLKCFFTLSFCLSLISFVLFYPLLSFYFYLFPFIPLVSGHAFIFIYPFVFKTYFFFTRSYLTPILAPTALVDVLSTIPIVLKKSVLYCGSLKPISVKPYSK